MVVVEVVVIEVVVVVCPNLRIRNVYCMYDAKNLFKSCSDPCMRLQRVLLRKNVVLQCEFVQVILGLL